MTILHGNQAKANLFVTSLAFAVCSFYSELSRKDVGKLGSITISAASGFLLRVVIIAAGKEMTKDHLRNIDSFFFVNLNRNSITIIVNTDVVFFNINLHLHLRIQS